MQINTKSTLQKYWQRVRQHKAEAFIVAAAIIIAASAEAIVPLYLKKLFNLLAAGGGSAVVPALFGVLALLAVWELIRWAGWRVSAFVNADFQSAIIKELSDDCFRYLHKHSFAFFNNNFVGSLVKRVNYFTRAFESTADRITWNFLPLAVELSIIMGVLFSTHRVLGFAILAWLILFMTVNVVFARYKIKFDLERSKSETKATAILADTITNQSNVKLFNGYSAEVARFHSAIDTVRRLRRFTWSVDNVFEGVQGLLATGLELGVFYLAIRFWAQGLLTLGDFVLLQTYVIAIFGKVWDFGKLIRYMYTDLADAAEMTQILDTPHEVRDISGARELAVTAGRVEFKNVDFYYHETRRIFSHLNLTISAGEKVALVGPSGAGKSTIVKLLLRQHDVTGGHIFIDNHDIAKVTQESLWAAVSLVPQEPILFHRSLMENIRYGKPGATDDEVIAAAKLAHCHEFISEFPDQYKTFVGERGVKLSGGERQRVAIARAILRNAPILVLDEATSSLDSESEHLIQDALANLMQNKTVIVIAHRLSTIMKMDRIIVVNHGRIMEEGSHQELLRLNDGLYNALWQRQVGGFMPAV